MYEDNAAAILMINSSKPTPRSRHIDIQHFAIQEWKLRGDIILSHLAGILNIADVLTKCLGWILHSRHIRRAIFSLIYSFVDIGYSTSTCSPTSLPSRFDGTRISSTSYIFCHCDSSSLFSLSLLVTTSTIK
jgi:hypothetical protein